MTYLQLEVGKGGALGDLAILSHLFFVRKEQLCVVEDIRVTQQ